jgi:glycerate 2-kinase
VLILNKHDLLNKKTADALKIIESGLAAAIPDNYINKVVKQNKIITRYKTFDLSKYRTIHVVAVGKAADSMAAAISKTLNVDVGLIVIPHNYTSLRLGKQFTVIHAGHPIPNRESMRAAKAIIALLKSARPSDFVLFLISGGASALVSLPYQISLHQKKQVVDVLLKCGASINEINSIRKHLSQVKGGRILEHLRCDAASLVMSDVVGDSLSDVASGLTYCDKTTFSDCIKIIERFDLVSQIPRIVLNLFKMGVQGKIPETPKRPKIPHVLIATNKDCIDAMANRARMLGYVTKILHPVGGTVQSASKKIIKEFSMKKKHCLIFGGETTVVVRGDGKGGRNQELVLRILNNVKQNTVVASVGTDGIDGNTKYAGAIALSPSVKHDVDGYLQNNNSNSFFKQHNGLILTGPTHTNLMDIGVILSPE